jgi:hypothetical protein
MSFEYSDPKREEDPHALPDIEVFRVPEDYDLGDNDVRGRYGLSYACAGEEPGPGWYWWSCFPGCYPDSEADGPYFSAEAALQAAREE